MAVSISLPVVQRAVIQLAAEHFAAADVRLEHVWLLPRSADVRGLRVRGNGYEVEVPRAELRWALWPSLLRGELQIREAALRDVTLRLVPERKSAQSQDAATTRGEDTFGTSLELPHWLRVRTAEAHGSLVALTPNGRELSGAWQARIANVEPGSTATLALTSTLRLARGSTPLATWQLAASASAAVAPNRAIEALAIDAVADPVDGGPGLDTVARVTTAGAAKRIALRMTSAATELARFDGELSASVLDGTWSLNVTPGIVRRFAQGEALPDVSGTSTGSLRADLAARSIAIELAARLDGSGWAALDARLGGLGTLSTELVLDATYRQGIVAADELVLAVASAERGDLLRVLALQPLRFDTRRLALDPDAWGEPAVRLEMNALPLRWLRPFSPGQNVQAGELDGALDIVRTPERTTVVVARPLVVRALRLDDVDGVPLPPLDITLVPHASLENGAFEAELEQLTITAPSGLRAELSGHARTSRDAWPLADFDGELSAHVPALRLLVPNLDRVHAKTRLTFDFAALALTVAAATAGATSTDGRELFRADLSGQRPLAIKLPRFAPDWDNVDPQALAVTLDRMPVAWVSTFLPELELRGAEVSGRLHATAGVRRGVLLTADEPLAITNLVPVYRGRAAHAPLIASVRPRLFLTTARSSFALEDLWLRSARGDELRGDVVVAAQADRPTLDVSVDVQGTFPSTVRELGATVGTVRWRQQSTLDPVARQFNLTDIDIQFLAPGGAEFLRLENVRPFAIAAKPFRASVDGGAPEVLRATVTPLELKRLLPRLFGFELEGTLPQGDFFGRVDGDGRIVFTPDHLLVFRDVTVRWGDTTLLDRVSAVLDYEIAYSADGVEARSVELRALGAGERLLAAVQTTAVVPLTNQRLVDSAYLTLDADLAALAAQPLLEDLPELTAGSVRATFDIRNAPSTTVAATAELEGAVIGTLTPLPDFAARLAAHGRRRERMQFSLPLRLRSERFGVSELDIDGQLSRRPGGGLAFDAAVTGSRVAMHDVRQLLDLLAEPRDQVASADSDSLVERIAARRSALGRLRTERHVRPIWSTALSGAARLEIGELVYPTFTAANFRGQLDVTPERLTLSDIDAEVLGAELSLDAAVAFDPAEAEPYSLYFDAALDDLELGEMFRAAAPALAPTAEGKFDVETTLHGSGLNPIDLALSALGQIRLAAHDGVFRGLAAHQGTGSTAARVVGVLTFSRELRALSRLLDRIGELRFENAEFLLERTTSNRVDVRTLKLLAPEIELEGSGSLDITGDRPLVLGDLDLSATLAARGDLAVLLDGMKLLDQAPDAAGYRSVTHSIEIGGTPAEFDMSGFWRLLDEGVDNARGSFGVGLRALNRRIARLKAED